MERGGRRFDGYLLLRRLLVEDSFAFGLSNSRRQICVWSTGNSNLLERRIAYWRERYLRNSGARVQEIISAPKKTETAMASASASSAISTANA
jgi:hypothetical protein